MGREISCWKAIGFCWRIGDCWGRGKCWGEKSIGLEIGWGDVLGKDMHLAWRWVGEEKGLTEGERGGRKVGEGYGLGREKGLGR